MGRRRGVRVLVAVLLIAAGAYLAVVSYLFVAQRSLLYFPSAEAPSLVRVGLEGIFRAIRLRAEDGLDLVAWYHPAPNPTAKVIVYFHGNGGHIERVGLKTLPYARAGFGLLLVEYRGYSGNPGTPSEAGLYQDARAALDHLRAEGVPDGRVVLFGESLGTGVAVQMASERHVGAVVLESPGTSIAAVGQYHYPYVPVRWLMRDRFDSLAKIGRVGTPLLVLHGGRDTVIPESFGRALFEAGHEPKAWHLFPDAGHVDLHDYGAGSIVIAFLDRYAPAR